MWSGPKNLQHANILQHADLPVTQSLVCHTASVATKSSFEPLNLLTKVMTHVHVMFRSKHDCVAALLTCMSVILGILPECAMLIVWCSAGLLQSCQALGKHAVAATVLSSSSPQF